MKRARRWLVWKFGPIPAPGKKPRKIPIYVSGELREKTDTPEDVARLATYEEAERVARGSGGLLKLGFALGSDGGGGYWQGYDSDGTLEGADRAPGYVERSPSGAGYHVIGYGRPFLAKAEAGTGQEWYSYGRYFTFTGEKVKDGPLHDLYDAAGTGPPPPAEDWAYERPVEPLSPEQLADLKGALAVLDPDPYHEWMRVALALQKVEGGLDLFLAWSRRSAKHSDEEATRKFQNVGAPHTHWKAVFNWAKETGRWPPAGGAPPLEHEVVDTATAPWVEYVLKDFIPAGTMVVGGMYGVGKTSQLLSLGLRACGCFALKDQWRPDLRRRVIWFTESMTQARRLLYAARQSDLLQGQDPVLGEWLRFYPAAGRFPVRFWAEQLRRLREENTVLQEIGDGGPPLSVAPLFILDTVPNLVVIESENDNSEIARVVSELRAAAGPSSLWLVTHLAKALREADPDSYTARGASAWGAGTDGEIFIYSNAEDPDDPHRYVRLGKDRVGVEHRQVRVATVPYQGTSTYRTFTEKFTAYLGGAMEPYPEEERRAAKEAAKAERREGGEQGRMIAAVARFKKRLADAPGRGLAVCHVRGRPVEAPEGFERLAWEDLLSGIGSKEGFRAKLVDALLGGFKPQDDGRFYLFLKPNYAVA